MPPCIPDHIPDSLVNLLGSVGGAVLGAILGSVGTYYISKKTEQRAKENELEKDDVQRVIKYSRSIYKAEVNIQTILPFMLKDMRLLKQIAELVKRGNTMMTLPVTIELDKGIAMNFRNEELINHWLTACLRVGMTNQLITDFKKYYVRTMNEVHTMLLNGQKPDEKTVREDLETLHHFANDVNSSVENTLETIFELGALINVHAENINDEAAKPKTMKDVNDYKVPKARYNKALKSLRKEFDPAKMFKDLNTNPSDPNTGQRG